MRSICIYLQVHQPYRVDRSTVSKGEYFGIGNKEIFDKVSKNAYLPTNRLLLGLLKKHKNFKLSLSISGIALDQMEEYSPETLKSFQDLARTGKVEILSETYYHSLAFFHSLEEFERQVEMHRLKIKKLFGQNPVVFRNTELSYTNKLAHWADKKGYKGILTEGWDRYLSDRNTDLPYKPRGTKNIKALLRNYRFSDDIAFLFSCREWIHWPLTADKFVNRIENKTQPESTVNLFMDYETFGDHQVEEVGIFDFLEKLPLEIEKKGWTFKTVRETLEHFEAPHELHVPKMLSWADTERDLSAWMGNRMQKNCLKEIYSLEKAVLETKNKRIIEDWRRLQTSDHFYYMCTKTREDGGVHAYFSPYGSPHEAYEAFKSALDHLKMRIKKIKNTEEEEINLVTLPQPV